MATIDYAPDGNAWEQVRAISRELDHLYAERAEEGPSASNTAAIARCWSVMSERRHAFMEQAERSLQSARITDREFAALMLACQENDAEE